MDVEILIHGVPDGQDYFGIKNEQTNMELFYDSSIESVKFVVETKKQGNQAYAYYSYLRYKNMIGAGGRPGSYFGVTLRMDMYYQDVMLIYNLLDIVFKKHVVGTLLSQTSDGYKYSVPSFEHKKTEIENLQNALLQLIQTSCVVSKFLPLDKSFLNPISTTAVCNIYDITDSLMLTTIKKYSKVALSPDYPLNVIKEYEKKLVEAEKKGGGIVAAKDQTIAEKDATISSLNSTITTQQNKITSLEQDSKKKDNEIQQLKQSGNLAKLVANIKEPITALAEYFRIQDAQEQPPTLKYGRKNFMLGILSCGLSVIIIALCIFSLFRTPSSSPKENKKVEKLEAQVGSLNKEIQRLAGVLKLKNDTIAVLRTEVNQPQQVNAIPLKIDISGNGFSGQESPMLTNKIYTIKVLKQSGGDIPNNKGKWTLTNATLKSGRLTDAIIKIQPNAAGEVKLEYTPNDLTQFAPKSRSAQAKAPSETTSIQFSLILDPNEEEVIAGNTYTVKVSGYEGDVETWRFSGCDGDKNSTLSAKITIKADAQDIAVTFVPKGMQLDQAQDRKLTRKVKRP